MVSCALYTWERKASFLDFIPTVDKPQLKSYNLKKAEIETYNFDLHLPQKLGTAYKRLNQAVLKGVELGCKFVALPPAKKQLIHTSLSQQASLIDGTRYLLAFLPHALAKDFPDWQKRPLTLILNSAFMAGAARILAAEGRFLHLYAPQSPQRQQLADSIFGDFGLICTMGEKYHLDSLVLAPPDYPKHPGYWQNWPSQACLPDGKRLPLPWGEAFLWDSLPFEEYLAYSGNFFSSINRLRGLAVKQEVLPFLKA